MAKCIARAEVQHFAIGAMRDDGRDVLVCGEDTAATVHALELCVVAGVDGGSPVLVDAGETVAVRAGRAAAERGQGDMLAAHIA